MKRKLLIGIFAIILCVSLTGCEKNKKQDNEQNEVQEANQTTNETENNDENKTRRIKIQKIEPDFYNLPTNVEMHVVVSNLDAEQEYYHIMKIGKNVLITEEVMQNDKVISKGLDKYYDYYKYNGNDTWDYYYNQGKEWRVYKRDIDMQSIDDYIIRTPKLFTKQSNLGNQTGEINLPEYGNVDVYIVTNGSDKYYYSEELNFNVKYENKDTVITIEKFDTNITSFGVEVPN